MDPLIPPSIQKLADAAGLTWNEYVNTLNPQDREKADRDIVFYTKMRNKQIDDQRRSGFNERTLAGPLGTFEIDPAQNASATPTASTPQDPLLTHPTFVIMAQSQNKTPQEYLDSLSPNMLENSRKILLGVEPEPQPAAQAPVLQTAVDPASRAGEEPGVLMRNEQNLVQENIGERQLLETRIADLEGSVDTQADVARLQQMKQRLVELGGSVESNQSTPQYDAAAEAYLEQLRGQQAQAAAVAPDVRAAEAEIASTTGLLSSGTLPPEMMASVQARKAAAEAALASGNAARDARVAEANGRTLSVENPVNGNVASSYGPILQPNPNEQPGADPAMYTPVPALTPNPSAIGAADPYAPPYAPSAGGVLPTAANEPIPMGQAPVDFATLEAQNSKSPVLINTTTPAPATTTANTAAQTPALSTTSSTTATRAPALSRGAGNMTANARGSALGITPRGEGLIRIGGAMYSGALKGDGLGAATREYGSIQDANRKAEVDAYNKAEATRIAELRAKGKGKGKTGKLAGPPTAVYKQATLSAITRIKDLLASESGFNPFDNLTGWTGSLLSSVPGTPAHDVLNSINTIEAAVGFDRLQKMRDDSPTGGALGQVTERELALLSQSLGSLKQSSSREQFVANLEAVEKHYQAAVAAVEAQQAEWYRMNGGTMPAKPTAAPSNTGSSNMSAADAIVGI